MRKKYSYILKISQIGIYFASGSKFQQQQKTIMKMEMEEGMEKTKKKNKLQKRDYRIFFFSLSQKKNLKTAYV